MNRDMENSRKRWRSNRYLYWNDQALVAVVIVTIAFSLLFSYLSVQKYADMRSTAFDLGVFSNVLNNAIHGHSFYSNLIGENFLSEHFSPFMYVLLVPYYLFPSPVTLLVLQAFFVAMAGVPLFMLTREWMRISYRKMRRPAPYQNLLPFVLVLSYLISPMVESPIVFDFHLMIFLPMFFFWQFYFFLKKKWAYYTIFTVLIVSLYSSFIFIAITALVAQYLVFRNAKYYEREESIPLASRKNLKYLAIFIAISVALFAYYFIAGYYQPVISGHPPSSVGPRSEQTGSASAFTGGLLITLFTNPGHILPFLMDKLQLKVYYMGYAGFSAGFLGLVFPEFLISALPYFMYGALSTYGPYFAVGYQYTMMVMPMVYIASAGGIVRLMRKRDKRVTGIRRKVRFSAPAVIVILLTLALINGMFYSPIAPPAEYKKLEGLNNLWEMQPGQAAIFARNVSSDIPKNSYILTQNNIYPYFANDYNAYTAPWSKGYSLSNPGQFSYIMADYKGIWPTYGFKHKASVNTMINAGLNSSQFGVYAEGYGVLVVKKNFTGQPVSFVPEIFSENGGGLHNSTYLTGGHLVLPGTYKVTVTYQETGNSTQNYFNIWEINMADGQALGAHSISLSNSYNKSGTYTGTFQFSANLTYVNLSFAWPANFNGHPSRFAVQKILIREISA